MGRRVEPAADEGFRDVPASPRGGLVPADLEVAIENSRDFPLAIGPTVPTAIALLAPGAFHRSLTPWAGRGNVFRSQQIAHGELLQFQGAFAHLPTDGEAIANAQSTHPIAEALGGFEGDTAQP